jgi:hypothetical protein
MTAPPLSGASEAAVAPRPIGEMQGVGLCLADGTTTDGTAGPYFYLRFDKVGEPYGAGLMPTLTMSAGRVVGFPEDYCR